MRGSYKPTRWEEIAEAYPGVQVKEHRDARGIMQYALADANGELLTKYTYSIYAAEWEVIDKARRINAVNKLKRGARK